MSLGEQKTVTVTHCSNRDSPVVGRDRARPSVFSSPYLPAQVSEADVQLMFLAGLPLVTAAVFCTGNEAKERNTRVQVPLVWQWESSHWSQSLKGSDDSKAALGPVSPQGHLHPLEEVPSPTRTFPASRTLCLWSPASQLQDAHAPVRSRGAEPRMGMETRVNPIVPQELEQCACVFQDGSV